MKFRPFFHLLLLIAVGVWATLTSFHWVEQAHLGILFSNARDTFERSLPAESKDVTFVEFSEADKGEFSEWPPAPLDYIMVLKRLAQYQPDVLVMADPLRWPSADTQFVTQFREALLPFPSVVFGFNVSAEGSEMTEDALLFSISEVPTLPYVKDPQGNAPKFSRILQVPDERLRLASQTGFTTFEGLKTDANTTWLAAVTDGPRFVPSVTAQAVTLFRRLPYANQHLRFGSNAVLNMNETHLIPLGQDGSLQWKQKPAVALVNALDLMIPDVGDESSKALEKTFGKHKIVVLGTTIPGKPAASLQQARAIAHVLALPPIQRAGTFVDVLLGIGAVLLCFKQIWFQPFKALVFGISAVAVWAGISILFFQSTFIWWSPYGGAILLLSTIYCVLWPRPVGK